MKTRKILFLMAVFSAVLLFPSEGMAQSDKTIDDKVLKLTEKKSQPFEQTVKKKKEVEKPLVEKPKQQIIVIETPKVEEKIKINNPCPDKFDVELVSVDGNSYQQEVKFSVMITNLDVNKSINVYNIKCYDTEGNIVSASSRRFDTRTNIPVKAEFYLRDKILPSKVHKFNALVINIDGCEVEFRDVPINWN